MEYINGKIYKIDKKKTANGKDVMTFTIRVSKKLESGEFESEFTSCTAWDDCFNAINELINNQVLEEKDNVIVYGKSKMREYKDKAGNTRQTKEFTVYKLGYVSRGNAKSLSFNDSDNQKIANIAEKFNINAKPEYSQDEIPF